jgi:hypothetical protein
VKKRGLTPARIERTTLWTGITRSTTELRGHVNSSAVKVELRKARRISIPGTRPPFSMMYDGLPVKIRDG